MRGVTIVLGAAVAGCGGGASQGVVVAAPAAPVAVPMRYDGHMMSVPVRVDERIEGRFIVDTGIGINLISEGLCRRVGCVKNGTYTGRRMSGQSVTVPLATVRSIEVGAHRRRDVVVGVIDGLADTPDIDGFLSLGYFEDAVTIDDANGVLVIEDARSLARRTGTVVPAAIVRDGPSLTVTIPMSIGDAASARCEVDTGSDSLILDERYMAPLGVDLAQAKVVNGKDETGQSFTRTFVTLDQPIHAGGVLRQERPRVMFQRIIHDGLVGHAFLHHWTVTFDVRNSRLVFGPPAARRQD